MCIIIIIIIIIIILLWFHFMLCINIILHMC
jgi:hypothetical protein